MGSKVMDLVFTSVLNITTNLTRNHSEVNRTFYYHDYDFAPVSVLMTNIFNFTNWATLFIIGFGVIGNILSFYVFTRSKLRKASSSRYFAAIAIVDIGYLLSTLCSNLTTWGITVYHVHGICPLNMYMNYIFAFLSIWYVTALVIEKFIGLYWPLKKANFCTVFRAKCVIVGLAIFAVVCYHFVTWTVGSQEPYLFCIPWPENELLETWTELNKADVIVVSVIPYVLIFCLSCLIAVKTWQFYKRNRSTGFRLHRRQTAFIPQDKEYKTSGLLLLIASVTLILGVPYGVCREFTITHPVVITLARFFQLVTYSIRPVIYIIASRPFRKKVWKIIKYVCLCKSMLRSSSFSEMHTVSQQTDNGRAIEIIAEKSMWLMTSMLTVSLNSVSFRHNHISFLPFLCSCKARTLKTSWKKRT